MARISYVNGRYAPHRDAMVHIEDRGYQFSDGVYEYIAFYSRKLLDSGLHFARLERSLKELQIAMPVALPAMQVIIGELIGRNGREDGGVYMQVTRGVARRDHPFPKNTRPSLVITIGAPRIPKEREVQEGVGVITCADIRWGRRDIKSVSLLANVLAKQEAAHAQAREAWQVENGVISEGAASNAYIVDGSGRIVTHPLNERILGGITRDVVLKLARKESIAVLEKPFTPAEAQQAAEAFLTSASANVLPVVAIDGRPVGKGQVGPVTHKLQELYAGHVFRQTGKRF